MKNQILKIQNKVTQKEAFQWTGDNEVFVRQFVQNDGLVHMLGNGLQIYNEEEKCWIDVPVNHYIIKGLKGEFYPCSPEVFNRSYKVSE